MKYVRQVKVMHMELNIVCDENVSMNNRGEKNSSNLVCH